MKKMFMKQIFIELESEQIRLCESRIWNHHRCKFCLISDGELDFRKEC